MENLTDKTDIICEKCSKDKEIALCKNCVDKNCLYTASVSQLSSLIAFVVSFGIIFFGLFSNNKLFIVQSKNTLDFVFILILKITTLIFLLPHAFRIFLSMSKMDIDVNYCTNFIRFLSNTQKIIDWFIRALITITLLCFLALNPLVSNILELKFFFWPLMMYSTLILWDISMFCFVKHRKSKGFNFIDDYKSARVSFFWNDLFGLGLYGFLFYLEKRPLDNEVIILLIVVIMAVISILLARYLLKDIYKNYKIYFLNTIPNLRCIINGNK